MFIFNLEQLKNEKGLKLVHLNVRSLLPKFQLLEEDFLDGNLDVICMSETWLKAGIPDELICNQNYNLLRHDREIINSVTGATKAGGGIVIYLKKGIIYEIFDSLCVCNNDIELFVVKIAVNGNKKQVLIVVYRPPNGNATSAISALTNCMEAFSDKYDNTEYVIMGDMNINYLNKRCCHVRSLKGLEKQYGLSQVIREPTRVTLNKETLIDRCLTNMKNQASSGIIPYFLSDHFPIYIIKKKQKIENKSTSFSGRCYLNYSLEALEELVNCINWRNICQEDNPNSLWNKVFLELKKIADLIGPIKEFSITRQRPVYFTSELIEYIKKRDTLLRLAIRKKGSELLESGYRIEKKNSGLHKGS